MAEYIEREALRAELAKGTIISDDLYGMGIMAGLDAAMKKIAEAPAADVVEVVRCKDCRRCNGFTKPDDIQPNEVGICRINMMAVKPDGFCYWGKRRGSNG